MPFTNLTRAHGDLTAHVPKLEVVEETVRIMVHSGLPRYRMRPRQAPLFSVPRCHRRNPGP
ncbi:hypothetical protein SMICM17S_12486 [Streptomyces microflavus]